MYIYNISVHASEDFFPKRAFHGGSFYQKIFSWGNFWGKFMGKGFLLEGAYDQIMSREGGAL